MTESADAAVTFDPVWEEIYRAGRQANRYPWDAVVSFVYRNRPASKPVGETDVLEIGCGTASNLWFAAREGFRVAGIDASESAIELAHARFAAEHLPGDLRVGDFARLPWPEASFDLVIDRAALTCVGRSAAARIIGEIRRVLRPGGAVFCNVYSDRHTSRAAGRPAADGLTTDIRAGTLVGVGQICFYDRDNFLALFSQSFWEVTHCEHVLVEDQLAGDIHAEWRLVARKVR
jgi:SAM-dependent methyltransferase